MTADLARECGDLEQWLPVAAALIPVPDTTPGTGIRTAPAVRPPWNPGTAAVVFGTVGTLADIEAEFRQQVTGTFTLRRRYRDTGAVLKAIPALGEAVDAGLAETAARAITAAITAIRQLPAIDLEERPSAARATCRYCGYKTLRVLPRSYRVTCLRQYACFDANGDHPFGDLVAYPDGTAAVYWADGAITIAENEPENGG